MLNNYWNVISEYNIYSSVALTLAAGGEIPLVIVFTFLISNLLSVYMLLFRWFGRIRLQINQHEISLIRELFGIKIKFPFPAPKDDICLLQNIRKYGSKEFRISSIQVYAKIIIWAGKNKKFMIGNNHELISESELDWLAHELSEWLNLPIRTE